MTIAQPDRLFGQPGTLTASQRPCAKPDNGNLESFDFNRLHHALLACQNRWRNRAGTERAARFRGSAQAAIMGFAMVPSK